MKKLIAVATVALSAGTAMADSIKGKVGVTGKIGFPDADITDNSGNRTGSFDPSSFSSTIGLRYFFN